MSLAFDQSLQEAEITLFETLRSEYESKGYRFVVHPSRSDLPDFFATYEPDAVAQGPGHNVAIEVKSRATPAVQQSLQRIRRLFEGRPDWRLRVVYVGTEPYEARHLPISSRAEVLDRAKEIEQLVANGNVRAAFVVAWSLLEAALNNAMPEADKRPRTPGMIVQTLAMDGLIPDELEQSLRSLIELRNRVIHGDLTVEPSAADVQTVLSAVRAALG